MLPLCLAGGVAAGWKPPVAHAGDGPMCIDPVQKDAFAKLRLLSLDLRGRVPSYDETIGIDGMPDVPAATVDEYLASPEFVQVARELHEALLWPNVTNLQLAPAAFYLRFDKAVGAWFLNNRANLYRGQPYVPCLDKPATFDSGGRPVTEKVEVEPGKFADREGWVEVEPYWAPGTKLRVCAFDAQAADTGLNAKGQSVPCNTFYAQGARQCGCGPNLRTCQGTSTGGSYGPYGTNAYITASFNEQLKRMVDRTMVERRPYTDMLTDRRMEVNGPIVHFLKYQGLVNPPTRLWLKADGGLPTLPDLKFNEVDKWVSIDRGPEHAGILTSPGYLLRFQTNRGRANRFHNSFLCAPFVPPPGGLPSGDDPCMQEPDLTKRCGCQYCHAALEPSAAYWGRWAEQGSAYLDPTTYPTFKQTCADCAKKNGGAEAYCADPLCKFYVTTGATDVEKANWGKLRSYEFRTDEQVRHIDGGPKAFVMAAAADGRLADCVVRNLWDQYVRRDPTPDEAKTLLPSLAATFTSSSYDFRALVKAIVINPVYGRVR